MGVRRRRSRAGETSDHCASNPTVDYRVVPRSVGAAGASRRFSQLGTKAFGLAADVSGQMTIELAVALPVLLVVAMVSVNALVFFDQCAVFDRAAHQAVRVHAASPAYGQTPSMSCSLAQADIESALGGKNVSVSVTCASAGRNLERYTARLEFSPTLFGMGLRSSVFGVSMPRLVHTSEYVVDSYKPGVVV